ncbi:ABC transporter permease [Ancylobacter amanitiformis]|uniref:ABC transport system permease protein n=1 Tax=Ancylobacter amanitiformis TaxID=217069 RepID=A0ABU0LRG9_9HYPH|nr:FtsX-like permease family protein [Ancylobacter amanitiformis]MDQ0511312.1 putative ABC transport system permease protein [Ancylobacter amanitiformis]
MTLAATSSPAGAVRAGAGLRFRLALALRFALRELRGGVRGFGVFLGCLALGVAAIAGVGSFSRALTDGLAREGTALLGGDAAFSLVQRQASPDELRLLAAGGRVSTIATLRAMARAGEGDKLESTLVELKAVDGAYPMVGTLETAPPQPLGEALAERDGAYGALADPALADRLGLKLGDRFQLGEANLRLAGLIEREPDALATGFGFGPRLLVSLAGLDAAKLIQPGSLARWTYRVRLADPGRLAAFVEGVKTAAPDAGFEVRTREAAAPRLEDNVKRFTQYLTLVGLTALLVGGVGVANAVKSHLDAKRAVIATFKSLGAPGGTVFAIYLVEVGLIATMGIAIGLVVGAVLPFLIAGAFGYLLPVPIEPGLQPAALALALGYGGLIALAFALWPLGMTHDVPVSALFRDDVETARRRPRRIYVILTALAIAALAGLAIAASQERRIAVYYLIAAASVLVTLRLVGLGIMAVARRLPRPRSTVARLALANIHRPAALTPTVVLSLGLGLTLLVSLALIDRSLTRELTGRLPAAAPSFFFLDIDSGASERFADFLRAHAPEGKVEIVPMLRGRLITLGDRPVESITPPPEFAWVLSSDRGITYSQALPEGSSVTAGAWWPADYAGPPLVSFEGEIADAFGLKVGDSVSVNVLGRPITARIANLRKVEWDRLAINFVMVFSPNTFAGAPHTSLATLAFPGGGDAAGERSIARAVAGEFPAVTAVRVKEALAQFSDIASKLILAIRGASLVTLLSSVLVLAGALAAGQHHRVYDAVILKTLGATRARLIGAYALEYAALGLVTALVAVGAGAIAAFVVVTRVMNLPFAWSSGAALGAVAAALVLTVGFGLIGTWRALGQKPARILRNL